MKLILVICLSFLSFQACNTKCETEYNSNLVAEQNSTDLGISSETAETIAKGYLVFDYELRSYNISVLENRDNWEVRFIGKGPIIEGTGPIVFLNKLNGERIYIIHSK